MKDYAKTFYKSKQWQNCRNTYLKSVGGLCENCLKKGIYRPAVDVHHIEHVTPENITNPEVTLNWGNLIALCRECHMEIHYGRGRRYTVDEMGRTLPIEKR